MAAENCSNCRFWAEPGEETVYGECRRRDPNWVNQGWPRTASLAWCGEWRRANRKRASIKDEGRVWSLFIKERRTVSNDSVFNPNG